MTQVPPIPHRARHRVGNNNDSQCQPAARHQDQSKAYDLTNCRNIMKSAFECSICYESMIDPAKDSRVLPCQHAFCRGCLTQLFDTYLADDSNEQVPVCPECRTPIGFNRVDHLPPNVQLNRLRNRLDELQQKHSSVDSSASKSSGGSANSNNKRRQKQLCPTAAKLSGDFCTAIHEFSYSPSDSRYLELRPGDLIEIIRPRCSMSDGGPIASGTAAAANGWAYGRIGPHKGYFPLAYTQPVAQRDSFKNLDSIRHPVVSALHNWRPSMSINFDGSNAAIPLLPLVKDRKYLVLTKLPNGWLQGQCQVTMVTGLFPASYVSRVHQRDPPSRGSRPLDLAPGSASSDNSLQSSPLADDAQQHTPLTETASSAAALPHQQQRTGFLQSLRNIFLRSGRQQHQQRQSSRRIEVFVGTPTSIASQLEQSRVPPPAPRQNRYHHQQQQQQQQQQHRLTLRGEGVSLYRCIQSRQAATDAELSLAKGELICVLSQRLDGWFRGLSVATQQSGLFPAACVRPCSLNS